MAGREHPADPGRAINARDRLPPLPVVAVSAAGLALGLADLLADALGEPRLRPLALLALAIPILGHRLAARITVAEGSPPAAARSDV